MIIAWIFGVTFGMILGVGTKANVDYAKCMKDKPAIECKKYL
jgi:hypothetical protein